MKIIIFSERLVFKQLQVNKKNTMEMFRKFYLVDNLTIVFMVANIQGFCSQTFTAGLKFKKFLLVTSELEDKNLEAKDLKKALEMIRGDHSRVTLVSSNEGDAVAAKKLGFSFILVGNPKKRGNPKVVITETIKDLSLLPAVLGLNK